MRRYSLLPGRRVSAGTAWGDTRRVLLMDVLVQFVEPALYLKEVVQLRHEVASHGPAASSESWAELGWD